MNDGGNGAGPEVAIESVELRVLDIERQVRFYHDMLGLYVRLQPAGRVDLSAEYEGPRILSLRSESRRSISGDARVAGHRIGLHFPSLDVLATCTARLIRHGVMVESIVDEPHAVLVLFRDAEQNDVELSARKHEPTATEFDLNELLTLELPTSVPVIAGTRIGGLTLLSGNPEQTATFYRHVVGLDANAESSEHGDYRLVIRHTGDVGFPRSDAHLLGLSRVQLSAKDETARGIYERASEFGARVIGTPEAFTLGDPDGLLLDIGSHGR